MTPSMFTHLQIETAISIVLNFTIFLLWFFPCAAGVPPCKLELQAAFSQHMRETEGVYSYEEPRGFSLCAPVGRVR